MTVIFLSTSAGATEKNERRVIKRDLLVKRRV